MVERARLFGKAELYDKDGEKRLSLSVVADQVLALRQPSKPELGESRATKPPARDEKPRMDYEDAVPF
jgi:hypothetical protein